MERRRISAANNIDSAYQRIDYSCVHVGKHVSSSKRRISWRFRYCDPNRQNFQQIAHKVQLTWSLYSGKATVFLDNMNITHSCVRGGSRCPVFCRYDRSPDHKTARKRSLASTSSARRIEFSFTNSRGHPMKIVALSECTPGVSIQYDLLVSGQSFFSLPSFLDSGSSIQRSGNSISYKIEDMSRQGDSTKQQKKKQSATTETESSRTSKESAEVASSKIISSESDDMLKCESPESLRDQYYVDQQQSNRLASAGLLELDLEGEFLIFEDELQSSYSGTLETLRDEVAAAVPQIEDIMSRAIIVAFSENDDDWCGHSAAASDASDMVIEADLIWEALQWQKCIDIDCPVFEEMDRKLSYIQHHVNRIVSDVRHCIVPPNAARRIIYNLATVLDLEIAAPMPKNLVLLFGLGGTIRKTEIQDMMSAFGEIEDVALSTECFDFGTCRFVLPSSAQQAVNASLCDGISMSAVCPSIVHLHMAARALNIRTSVSSIGDAEEYAKVFAPTDLSFLENVTRNVDHYFGGERIGSPSPKQRPRHRRTDFSLVVGPQDNWEVDGCWGQWKPSLRKPTMYQEYHRSHTIATVSTDTLSVDGSEMSDHAVRPNIP